MSRPACRRTAPLAALAALASSALAQFPVEPPVVVGVLTSPAAARVADVDGDGHLDLVTFELDGLNHRMATLLNDGAGGFTEILGDNAAKIDVIQDLADLHGDGELDVLFGGSEARLFRGVGDGSFGPFEQLIEGLSGSDKTIDGEFMRAADIDGDGDTDVVLGDNPFDGFDIDLQAKLLLNDGSGSFSLAQTLPAGDAFGQDLILGDVDGDGSQDVFLLHRFDGTTVHWDDDGSGEWSEVLTWSFPVGTSDLELVDLDADGALDMAGVSGAFLYVRPGTGTGSFAPALFSPLDATGVTLRFHDMDLDGTLDGVLAESQGFLQGQTELLPGNGDGSFGPGQLIDHGITTGLLGVGDFDGNGAPDLLSAESGPDGRVELHSLRNYTGTPWSDLGGPLVGALGSPILLGEGDLTPGATVRWDLHRAAAAPFLVIGVSELGAAFKGGTLHPAPDLVVGLAVNGQGSTSIAFPWPSVAGGFPLVLQAWIPDATQSLGFAATNGLRGAVP